jgi:hypothetical protein
MVVKGFGALLAENDRFVLRSREREVNLSERFWQGNSSKVPWPHFAGARTQSFIERCHGSY